MFFSKLSHNAVGVTGTSVYITYTLTKSDAEVAIANLTIGYTIIDLIADLDTEDINTFKTRGAQEYLGLSEADGIMVSVNATGKVGSSWSLSISLDGVPLSDNPIEEETDDNGYLNHNQKHN